MSTEVSLDDDPQLVPNDDDDGDDDDNEVITANQEAQFMSVIIPLNDCLKCHVRLTHEQVSRLKCFSICFTFIFES